MWSAFHRLSSPPTFYRLAGKLIPWLSAITLVLMLWGLFQGLAVAPPDYQQGDGYRIIFVHVPAAWMSLFVYTSMAVAGAVALVWRLKLAEVYIAAAAPLGASFTFVTLVAGSLWGKPMWGTYWVWSARLTSELILLFLYLGVIGLYNAIDDRRSASRAASVLAVVGVVNVPIIHYSVDWWHSLHQGSSFKNFMNPSIAVPMLIPLMVMVVAFTTYFFAVVLVRMRSEILSREHHSRWVRKLAEAQWREVDTSGRRDDPQPRAGKPSESPF